VEASQGFGNLSLRTRSNARLFEDLGPVYRIFGKQLPAKAHLNFEILDRLGNRHGV
jgi:hypothetical protein